MQQPPKPIRPDIGPDTDFSPLFRHLKPPSPQGMDYVKSLGSGVFNAAGGLTRVADTLSGGAINDAARAVSGKGLSNHLTDFGETIRNTQSPAMKREMGKQFWDDETNSFGEATTSLPAITGNLIESAPAMLPGIGAAGLTGKAASIAAFKKATQQGLSETAAKSAATKAGASAAGIAGSVAEGTIAGGMNAEQAEREVMRMPIETIAQHPEFQSLKAQGASDQQAQQILAKKVADQVMVTTGAAVGLTGAWFNRFIGKLASGGSTGRLRAAGKGMLLEAPTEGVQSVLEQGLTNKAIQENVDKDRKLSSGVMNAGVGGVIVGGAMGGGVGLTMGGKAEPNTPTDEATPVATPEVAATQESTATPTAEAITEAAPEAAPTPEVEVYQTRSQSPEHKAEAIRKLREEAETIGKQAKEATHNALLLRRQKLLTDKAHAQESILDGDKLRANGTLFPTEENAKTTKIARNQLDHEPVKVGEGWALRPKRVVLPEDRVIGEQEESLSHDKKEDAIPGVTKQENLTVPKQVVTPPKAAPPTQNVGEAQINQAAQQAATAVTTPGEPTEAQIKAGNYKKGHVQIQGMDVSIENPVGSERKGKDKTGKPWSVKMKSHYGYLKGTMGFDKDHVDVFLGDDAATAKQAYVIDQIEPGTGKFDEHKVMIGYKDESAAKAAYLENYTPGWKGIGAMQTMSIDDFRKWSKSDGPKKGALLYKKPQVITTSEAVVQPKAGKRPKLTVDEVRQVTTGLNEQDLSKMNIKELRHLSSSLGGKYIASKKGIVAKLVNFNETEKNQPAESIVGKQATLKYGTNTSGGAFGQGEVGTISGTPHKDWAMVDFGAGRQEKFPVNEIDIANAPVKAESKIETQPTPKSQTTKVQAPEVKPSSYGQENKVFTEDAANKAREILKKKLGQVSAGLDPEIVQAGITLAGYHIESGARSFTAYTKAMVTDLGDVVRPYLRSWYEGVRYYPGSENIAKDMTAAADIDTMLEQSKSEGAAQNDIPTTTTEALEGVSPEDVRTDGARGNAGERSGSGRLDDNDGSSRTEQSLPTRGGRGNSATEVSEPNGKLGGQRDSNRVGTSDTSVPGKEKGSGGRSSSGGRSTRAKTRAVITKPKNYIINPDLKLGKGGAKTKFKDNIAAINTLRALQKEGRAATPEEQDILARYVGWGGLPQAFTRPDGTIAKGWEKEVAELSGVLNSQEHDAAKRSTQDAHYTSETIVRSMYDAVRRLGFLGGKILEPSTGTGNFIGMMNLDTARRSQFTGVELDTITGEIAKYLYPQATIHQKGFQEINLSNDQFDMVIGNPPFGQQKIFDPNHKDISEFNIHSFFFAKSIEKAKPGGLIAMVVSRYMMDSSRNSKARGWISSRTNFLGAIRLPNTAFQENANTEVVTDIIFLQKLKTGEQSQESAWNALSLAKDDATGEEYRINKYFIDNPNMMLGRPALEGKMNRANEFTLQPTGNLQKQLDKAIKQLPQNIHQHVYLETAVENAKIVVPSENEGKVFGYTLDKDNKIVQRQPDVNESKQWSHPTFNKAAEQRVRGMMAVRKALRDLMRAELSSNEDSKELADLRHKLNQEYDTFQKNDGYIHAYGNSQAMRLDPDYSLLQALESKFDKGITEARAKKEGSTERGPSADKADIFKQRVLSPHSPPTHATNVGDALSASLFETGMVDVAYMADLYGKSKLEVIQELGDRIYFNPGVGWETADQYLSGNVRAKLNKATDRAKKDAALLRNVKALEKVIPKDIVAFDIKAQMYAPWLPSYVITDFSQHLFNTKPESTSNVLGQWAVTFGKGRSNSNWDTDRMGGQDIFTRMLENRTLVIKDKIETSDGDKYVVNKQATLAVEQKADAMRREFANWIWSDDARSKSVARIYNDLFNTNVPRNYDGSHLQFPGKNPAITLDDHQINVAWRMIQDGSTLADHVVGAGKTFAAIAGVMEMRRMGLVSKPMVIVPNHLLDQWSADFSKLYPSAKILTASKSDLNKDKRKLFMSRVALGDWDAVIIAHSSFGLVGMPHQELIDFRQNQVNEIDEAIATLRETEGAKSYSVKQAAKKRDAIKAQLQKAMESKPKDDVVTFDELGVDMLVVDELHEFKNLFYATQYDRVKGLGNKEGSQKAMDLFIKANYLQKRNNGQGLIGLTGTPISNTVAEMYTMNRYFNIANMQDKGIAYFDAWARSFANPTTESEMSVTGQYKQVTRFRSFDNMPELRAMYNEYADVVSLSGLKEKFAKAGKRWPVPEIQGGEAENVIVEISEDQLAYNDDLIARAENLKNVDPREDNMLKITNEARKLALDARLLIPGAKDHPGNKVNRAADLILQDYQESNADRGTQLVFIDLSIPAKQRDKEAKVMQEKVQKHEAKIEKGEDSELKISMDEFLALDSKFSVYDELKKKLIAKGIPEAEIAFIHDATEATKSKLFAKVNSGEVRVLIGSTQKMGAGTNAQERMVSLHHLDAPWRPSDMEQREGRIIRRGNKLFLRDPDNFKVKIRRYGTERSLDAMMWQTLETKSRFIEQARNANNTARNIDDIDGQSVSFAAMKAALSGNPLILEQIELQKKLSVLEAMQTDHNRQQFNFKNDISRLKNSDKTWGNRIENVKADMETIVQNPNVSFTTENGVTHTDAGEGNAKDKVRVAGKAIITQIVSFLKAKKNTVTSMETIGSYRGFDLSVEINPYAVHIALEGKHADMEVSYSIQEKISESGLITKLENQLASIDQSLIDAYENNKRLDAKELIKTRALVKPFDQTEELAKVRAEHDRVVAELTGPEPGEADATPNLEANVSHSRYSIKKAMAEPKGISVEEANRVIEEFKKEFNGAGRNHFVVTGGREAVERGLQGTKGGFYIRGFTPADTRPTVVLVASAASSASDARNTLRHEMLAHYGLGLFDEATERKILDSIIQSKNVIGMRSAWAFVDEHYADKSEYEKAEEVLAHVAEKERGTIGKAWDRVITIIANALRSIGLLPHGYVSRAELNRLVISISDGIKANQTAYRNRTAAIKEVKHRRNPDQNATLTSALEKAGLVEDTRSVTEKAKGWIDDKWTEAKAGWGDRFKEGAFDQFHGIKVAENHATSNLPAEQSGYVGARLSTGITSVMSAILNHGAPKWANGILARKEGTKGFLEILEPVKSDLQSYFGWMIGRRAQRLMAEDRENLFTQDEINALLALAAGKETQFKAVADEIHAFKQSILDVAQQAGLIDAATRPAWDQADYIPFYRIDEQGKTKGAHGKNGLAGQSSGIRQLRGGEAGLNDPLENFMQNFAHLLDASLKNNAIRKVTNNLEGSSFMEEIPAMEYTQSLIPLSQVKKLLRESGMDEMSLKMVPPSAMRGFRQMWSIKAPTDPDVIRVMDGGKAKYYKVHDPALLRGLTAVNQEALGGVVKVMRQFKRLLTTAVTAEPTFMLRNFIRDAAHAWAINEDGFKFGIDSLHGAAKSLKEEGGTIDMLFSGASFMGGYINSNDPEAMAEGIQRALLQKGYTQNQVDSYMGTVVNSTKDLWHKYRTLGDAIENANREAVFESAGSAGKSKAQQSFEAKDLMDYSMRGNWTIFRLMGDVLPFFNARLQGLYKLGRAGALPLPGVAKKKAMARGGMIALASLSLLMLNKDRDEYEELEDWDKDSNWHFFFGDEHVRIPKPFEIGLMFGTIPERFARSMLAKDDADKTFERLMWAMTSTLEINPFPQAVRPWAEVYANKNWFTGRAIEGMADEGKLPSARYSGHTSDTMRLLSDLFGDSTGLSPKKLEHLWRGYLGTLGAYVLGASDIGVRWMSGRDMMPEFRAKDLPVLRGFYRTGVPHSTRYRTELYKMLVEVNQIHKTVRALRKDGRHEASAELRRKERNKLSTRKVLGVTSRRLRRLRSQIDAVRRNPMMGTAEKTRRIDAMTVRANELSERTVRRVDGRFL